MRTVLITGGNSGIGLTCAQRLVSEGNRVILAGRDPQKVLAAAKSLRSLPGEVDVVSLNLSSLASVRASAAEVKTLLGPEGRLDALLCNAGAQFRGPVSFSEDGFEETFAVNCLGHFLFFHLLLDTVSDTGRVVFTASGTHDPETMDGKMVGKAIEPDAMSLSREGKSTKAHSGGVRYSTSKLCDILYAYELARRLAVTAPGIQVIAFDPGFTPETGLARTAPAAAQWLIQTRIVKSLMKTLGVTMGSTNFSGRALASVATAPQYAHATGKYIQSNDGQLIEAQSSATSHDEARARKLWKDSETLVVLLPGEVPRRLS